MASDFNLYGSSAANRFFKLASDCIDHIESLEAANAALQKDAEVVKKIREKLDYLTITNCFAWNFIRSEFAEFVANLIREAKP